MIISIYLKNIFILINSQPQLRVDNISIKVYPYSFAKDILPLLITLMLMQTTLLKECGFFSRLNHYTSYGKITRHNSLSNVGMKIALKKAKINKFMLATGSKFNVEYTALLM